METHPGQDRMDPVFCGLPGQFCLPVSVPFYLLLWDPVAGACAFCFCILVPVAICIDDTSIERSTESVWRKRRGICKNKIDKLQH